MEASATSIPFALEADSVKALSAAMLKNNLKHGKAFQYQIMGLGKKFYAWYYIEADMIEDLSKALNVVNEQNATGRG